MTTAKYGFEQVPVISGAPPNVAVLVGPLNVGGSVTTFPVMVDTKELVAEVCVDSVVPIGGAEPLGKLDALSGEHPTNAGACLPTFEHSS